MDVPLQESYGPCDPRDADVESYASFTDSFDDLEDEEEDQDEDHRQARTTPERSSSASPFFRNSVGPVETPPQQQQQQGEELGVVGLSKCSN